MEEDRINRRSGAGFWTIGGPKPEQPQAAGAGEKETAGRNAARETEIGEAAASLAAAAGAQAEDPAEDEMTIEEIFAALDGIIDEMESGSGSLEDAFARYEQGIRLVKRCSGKIDRIEKQVLVLSGEKGGADEHEF